MQFDVGDKVVHVDLVTYSGLHNVYMDIKDICKDADKNVMREGVVEAYFIASTRQTLLVKFKDNTTVISDSSYFIPLEVLNNECQ